ncbi:MAG: cysteine hydrolase family protein [Brachymonas sp.]|nr:cysteine hydrolase family protein [Brachymonas sp.]
MSLAHTRPALILIDVQQGFAHEDFFGGHRNNPDAEQRCGQLLAAWRQLRLPVFHIRHSSQNPLSPLHASHAGFRFHPAVQPQGDEPVITKTVNSAFIGTDLKERLDQAGIRTVVIAGITTNHCVSTTTRMAGNYGFAVYCVHDACACFDRAGALGEQFSADTIHRTALANLHGEFAQVIDTEEVLQQVLPAAAPLAD